MRNDAHRGKIKLCGGESIREKLSETVEYMRTNGDLR